MEIVDNFLENKDFKSIKKLVMSKGSLPLFITNEIANFKTDKQKCYFFNILYTFDSNQENPYFKYFYPLLNKIPIKKLWRVKVNCYPRTNILEKHPMHKDYDVSHRGCIFSLNDCDGGTYIGDKFIQSKENRALFLDPSTDHCSTNTTDTYARFNININFI